MSPHRLLFICCVSFSLAGCGRETKRDLSGGNSDSKKKTGLNPGLDVFTTVFLEKYLSLELAFEKDLPKVVPVSTTKGDFCNVSELRLEGIHDPMRFDTKKVFATGSQSRLYISQKKVGGHSLMVKTVDLAASRIIKAMIRDKAFLYALKGTKIVPEVYKVSEGIGFGKRPELCLAATIVTEFLGGKEIGKAREVLSKNPALLGRVGARIIELVKQLHSIGFVHGDIHHRNFVYESNGSIPETLRMIDFGRVEPFITLQGEHVAESKGNYGLNWNARLLSTSELEGWRKTRKDDMYRIAELLLFLGRFDDSYVQNSREIVKAFEPGKKGDPAWESKSRKVRSEILKLKMNRDLSSAPPVLRRFFIYCRDELQFATRPQYDYWINELVKLTKPKNNNYFHIFCFFFFLFRKYFLIQKFISAISSPF